MRRYLISTLLIILILLSFTQAQTVQAQDLTTFILVRHAEKADDGSRDPDLSEAGHERARTLAELLKKSEITAVYSTPYIRTQKTAAPTAELKGLDVKEYDPTDRKVLESIMASQRGGTILILGHSNTTPRLVNQLIGDERYPKLDESDYSNIFVVTVSEIGNGKVTRLTY